ncbi:hypothetical protein [Kitasatospora sp. LaBMicrA B282]|uniref:hypothetical protein n=1 Tax=Kitasatospora sp. LaBMicrA B282 TaxID=3420949 RepID=UPI003D133689
MTVLASVLGLALGTVGIAVAGSAYYLLCRRLDLSAELHAVAESERLPAREDMALTD